MFRYRRPAPELEKMQRSNYTKIERKRKKEKESGACLFWWNFGEYGRVVDVLLSVLVVDVHARAD